MKFDLSVQFRFEGFRKLPEAIRDAIRERTIDETFEVYKKVLNNVGGVILSKRSGELYNSIKISSRRDGNDYVGRVYVDPATPKAFALEFGGKDFYTIYPTSKQNLMFFWEREARWFVGPMVNHPPSKEYAYLRSALIDVNLAAGYTEALDEAIQRTLF